MKGWLVKGKEKGAQLLTYLLRCFPIHQNKVFMMSYYGKGYDCNPKYLTEYLLTHKAAYPWKIVWAFDEPKTHEKIKGIKAVKVMTLRFFYELCTSKIIITNYRMPEYFNKRKTQYYIQTWHSSLRLKKIERDTEATLPAAYIKMAQKDARQCDLVISGCAFSSQIFKNGFWYSGPILECGTPRNDCLMCPQEEKEQQKKQLGIAAHKKVILYAPTFRKDHDLSVYDLDYKKLQQWLLGRWGGEWTVLIRLHPHLHSEKLPIQWTEEIKDVSRWEDVQQLLAIADVLISDYSSLIFDFCLTGRPCFLYTPDIEAYRAYDRDFYFEIEKLPFEMALDKESLKEKIIHFDEEKYERLGQEFMQKVGSFEQGNASKVLAEHMAQMMSV